MSDTTSIIKRLRALGLSQSEISRRTGIPQPRLSRWEGGEVPDAADDALKLAELIRSLKKARPTPSKVEARRALDFANSYLDNVKGLKKPEAI